MSRNKKTQIESVNGTHAVAFKFGQRMNFALRHKMQKPPITRVPAIYVDLINRPS